MFQNEIMMGYEMRVQHSARICDSLAVLNLLLQV